VALSPNRRRQIRRLSWRIFYNRSEIWASYIPQSAKELKERISDFLHRKRVVSRWVEENLGRSSTEKSLASASVVNLFADARQKQNYVEFIDRTLPILEQLTVPELDLLAHATYAEGMRETHWRIQEERHIKCREVGSSTNASKDLAVLGLDWTGPLGHHGLIVRFKRLQMMGLVDSKRSVVLQRQHMSPNRSFAKLAFGDSVVLNGSEWLLRTLHYQLTGKRVFAEFLEVGEKLVDINQMCDIAEWEWYRAGRSPLTLDDERIISKSIDVLRKWGLRDGDWFVAFHVRSGSSRFDSNLNNASVESYIPAMKFIIENGGWVIRMGDASMPPLRRFSERVVDYAHAIERASWLDCYFWSHAAAAVGTNSGGTDPFHVFGVPTLRTNNNVYPMMYFAPRSILLPKLFRAACETAPMSMRRTLSTRWPWSEVSPNHESGVEAIDNSPDDILEGVKELLKLKSAASPFLTLSERQNEFQSIRTEFNRTERMPIADSFVQNHPDFLS
jgi:putative glycosyltransferase (TIGR04372 family)